MVHRFAKILALIVCLASVSLANDFKLANNKEYKTSQSAGQEPEGVVVPAAKTGVMPSETEKPSDLFFKYDYTETKDFCKQFLTLVVAVLVFSLTFSEKVVGFPSASLAAKLCLVFAWTSMLISIVSCGIGLTFMALAGGDAVYGGAYYHIWAEKSYRLIIVAGCSFVTGLLLLIVAAICSVYFAACTRPKATPTHAL